MKQAEVQEGGIYVSKGKGMRAGKRVQLKEIKPQPEGPPRVTLIDLDTKRRTYPRADSFQQSYVPVELPSPVVNQVADAIGKRPNGSPRAPVNGTSPFIDVREELHALEDAFSAAAGVIRKLREKLGAGLSITAP